MGKYGEITYKLPDDYYVRRDITNLSHWHIFHLLDGEEHHCLWVSPLSLKEALNYREKTKKRISDGLMVCWDTIHQQVILDPGDFTSETFVSRVRLTPEVGQDLLDYIQGTKVIEAANLVSPAPAPDKEAPVNNRFAQLELAEDQERPQSMTTPVPETDLLIVTRQQLAELKAKMQQEEQSLASLINPLLARRDAVTGMVDSLTNQLRILDRAIEVMNSTKEPT